MNIREYNRDKHRISVITEEMFDGDEEVEEFLLEKLMAMVSKDDEGKKERLPDSNLVYSQDRLLTFKTPEGYIQKYLSHYKREILFKLIGEEVKKHSSRDFWKILVDIGVIPYRNGKPYIKEELCDQAIMNRIRDTIENNSILQSHASLDIPYEYSYGDSMGVTHNIEGESYNYANAKREVTNKRIMNILSQDYGNNDSQTKDEIVPFYKLLKQAGVLQVDNNGQVEDLFHESSEETLKRMKNESISN